jgi:dissimilatory sulfite reductase (desulfoviridin) alpha/beta subunit
VCREKAIRIEDGRIEIDREKCNYCGRCAFSCPTDAYETAPGYLLSFGGLFGNRISKGVTVLPFVEDQDTLFRICDAALEFFKENAVPGERFKFTIDRVGQEKLDETIWNAFEGN